MNVQVIEKSEFEQAMASGSKGGRKPGEIALVASRAEAGECLRIECASAWLAKAKSVAIQGERKRKGLQIVVAVRGNTVLVGPGVYTPRAKKGA